jgi:potassium efflux system protein
VLATFGLLGVRWGNLQWMAAALTVGLGFGLQEIFANFVSGLIVLFERRVRVGDVITVGSVTGRVTSISTRASTLLDFDRKEVMVPNKTLITEQLTNWTLTDAVTRLIVKVGVAYGSDVDTVHRALREAAHDEPMVLEQPPPASFFMGLGPSSLDFELRVFVQRVDLRPEIMSALHRRIVALLGEAGVTIPFPQMDVWMRSVPPASSSAAEDPGTETPRGHPVTAEVLRPPEGERSTATSLSSLTSSARPLPSWCPSSPAGSPR